MWFAERRPLQVALLDDRVVIARAAARGTPAGTDVLAVPPATGTTPAWQPAVQALTGWLGEHKPARARLQVFLSANFVRWQLIEWKAQLGTPQEMEAYARLRFRAAFGAAADTWRVEHSGMQPGQPLPACAIDEGLFNALAALQSVGGTRVQGVTPYFSAAFDRWRKRLGRKTAWFGVAEPNHLTLGLLHRGAWQGLRASRHTGSRDTGWRHLLPPLQAQMRLASGLDLPPDVPLYLAGCSAAPQPRAVPGLVWLAPEVSHIPAQGVERMAWGV